MLAGLAQGVIRIGSLAAGELGKVAAIAAAAPAKLYPARSQALL